MMHTQHLPTRILPDPREVLFSVLENAEAGVVVVGRGGHAIYMNSSARNLLNTGSCVLPVWVGAHLAPMLERVRGNGCACVERWTHTELVLRVRARPLEPHSEEIVLEMTVAHVAGGDQVEELLSRSLCLSRANGRLLLLLWRGKSNEEIAGLLSVRVGTVKSRLFRLYQKLGVKRRPAAVLRAAEVLSR